jgi:hypothetical protein
MAAAAALAQSPRGSAPGFGGPPRQARTVCSAQAPTAGCPMTVFAAAGSLRCAAASRS